MVEKKVIVISGGSKGLGNALVKAFLNEGFYVATFSRKESKQISELKEIFKEKLLYEEIDSNNLEMLRNFVLNVYKKYRRIDALINNAGTNIDQLLSMSIEDDVKKLVDLNIVSTILLTKAVSRAMLKQGKGSIISISSVLGHRGFKGASVYSATKAAIDGFTRSAARELGIKNIRVNSVSPGYLHTDMTQNMSEKKKSQIIRRTPMGRLGEVEDIVGVVKFLVSDESSFITGQTFVIDGGLTC